jgi:hypothetical protein
MLPGGESKTSSPAPATIVKKSEPPKEKQLTLTCGGHESLLSPGFPKPIVIPMPSAADIDAGCYYFVLALSEAHRISRIVLANAGSAFITIRFATPSQAGTLQKTVLKNKAPLIPDTKSSSKNESYSTRGRGSPDPYVHLMSPLEQQIQSWRIMVPDRQLLSREQLVGKSLKSMGRTFTFTFKQTPSLRVAPQPIQIECLPNDLNRLIEDYGEEETALICIECRPFLDPLPATVARAVGLRSVAVYGPI